MAPFNPEVPKVQDSNYLGYSKGVDAPAPSQTGKFAFGLAGDLLTQGTKIVDEGIKKDIDNKIYIESDLAKNELITNLENMRNKVPGITPLPSSNPALSFAEEDSSESLPEGVQAIENQLGTLQSANRAGKINDTYYTQQLNTMVKSLRNQFPGYRDYIDAKVSQVTGLNPANSYYRNLMQDVNSNLAAKGAQSKSAESMIIAGQKDGVQGAAEMWQTTQVMKANGIDPTPSVLQWYNKGMANKFKLNEAKTNLESREVDNKDKGMTYSQSLSTIGDTYIDDAINNFRVGVGEFSIKDFNQKVADKVQRNETVDPQQLQQAVTSLGQAKAQFIRNFYAEARRKLPNGDTMEKILGVDTVKQMAENKARYFDVMMDSYTNDKTGSATMIPRQLESLKSFDQKELLSNPDAGRMLRAVQATNALGGPQASGFIFQQAMRSGLSGALNTFFADKSLAAVASPTSSITADVKQAAKLTDGSGNPMPLTKLVDKLVRIPTIIASDDPRISDAMKLKYAEYAFDPRRNGELLDGIKMDANVNGVFYPGKYSALGIMTAPQMTDSMWKLRNKTTEGQQAWNNYRDWTTNSFAKLFRSDIATLNGMAGTMVKQIAWDSENSRFVPLPSTGPNAPRVTHQGPGETSVQRIDTESINQVNKIVNRLNIGLSNVKNVLSKENKTTEDYIAPMLIQLGLNPDTNHITGLPKAILDNIAATKIRRGEGKTFFEEAK